MAELYTRSASSLEAVMNDENRPGSKTMSHSIVSGSLDSLNDTLVDTDSHSVSSTANIQFEFFDKEEQKRREEYRNRVERHYCRLIEEERLSPESASVLSDAFAEAEVRAKYWTVRESVLKPEYHTGIDKSVWQEIDHQRSKSFERLKCTDIISTDTCDNKSGELHDCIQFSKNELDSSQQIDSFQVENASNLKRTGRAHLEDSSENNWNSKGEFLKSSVDISASCGHYHEKEDHNETLNIESEEECTDTNDLKDEFDFVKDGQREWISRRGNIALEKSMDEWFRSPVVITGEDDDAKDRQYFKQQLDQYREKIAAKERGRITELLKQSSSLPSASPTPLDYDADEEVSTKETRSSTHSLDQWSDISVDDSRRKMQSSYRSSSKSTCDYLLKPASCRSSFSSEKGRVDHSTYQSYTAGLLHSSGKSEKFLRLQKHFAVLERITDIEEKSRQVVTPFTHRESSQNEMYTKYDVQSRDELEWLYQELNEARRNEEFFYDLQKLEVYRWKPSVDKGLKRKGKSLNDLRKIYEQFDEEEKSNHPLQNTKQIHEKAGRHHLCPRPLYGTNIPEKLDAYEILVEAKKQKNKEEQDSSVENLHIRSISAPFMKHALAASSGNDEDHGHRRSDSFKGALFANNSSQAVSEKKLKPTVAEVTPLPRQESQKSQVYQKIKAGPHDFASHVTPTETVARPLQSNLQIYNSLENPQYKATLNLNHQTHSVFRGHSNDNLTLKKHADSNSSGRSPSKILIENNQGPNFLTADDLCSSKCAIDIDYTNSDKLTNEESETTSTPIENFNASERSESNHRYSTLQGPNVVNDALPKTSVRDFVTELEKKSDCDRLEGDLSKTADPMNYQAVAKPETSSVHYRQQFLKQPLAVEPGQVITEFTIAPLLSNQGPPRTLVSTVLNHSMPIFKITNLRPLAVNNEFCKSKFFPKQSTSAEFVHCDRHEPVLHMPVMSQIFRQPMKKQEAERYKETKRNSSSSTVTFIVKDSDDEYEAHSEMITGTGLKDSFNQCRSKSVPDLYEQKEPLRPRAAKSQTYLNADIESDSHYVPRAVSHHWVIDSTCIPCASSSVKFHSRPPLYNSSESSTHTRKFGEINEPYSVKSSRNFQEYMPPVQIVIDSEKSEIQFEKPEDKLKSTSNIGKMTMDYLQEIGQEWAERKKVKESSVLDKTLTDKSVILPTVKPFVGSDLTSSPNMWVPVIETRQGTKRNGQNSSESEKTVNHPVPGLNDQSFTSSQNDSANEQAFLESKNFFTLPRKKKMKAEGFKFSTIPRMRPDRQTNKARDEQIHLDRSKSDLGNIDVGYPL